MKNILYYLFLVFIFLSAKVNAQEKPMFDKKGLTEYVSGFGKEIFGQTLEYKTFHADAVSALLIRCLNNDDYIEWETANVPESEKEFVTFAWITSYATGTCDGSHKFKFFINDKETFIFSIRKDDKNSDWAIKNNERELKFKFIKRDNHEDHSGYMFLTIPKKELKGMKTLKLKVKGDSTGTRNWYMVFKNVLETNVKVTAEYALLKNDHNKKLQRVKVQTHYFDDSGEMRVSIPGKEEKISQLKFGLNEYILPVEFDESQKEIMVKAVINGKEFLKKVELSGIKPFTVYIIPHSHVDIGYTELQTEVKKSKLII